MTFASGLDELCRPLEDFTALHRRTIRRHGRRVIDLSFPNPILHRDGRGLEVLREVVAGIEPERVQYTPFGGTAIVRRRIAAGLARGTGIPFGATDVVVTPGATAALSVAFQVLFAPGDEVIVPVPCWMDHPLFLRTRGAVPVPVPLDRDGRLDLDAIEAAIGPATAGIVLSQPGCPTGVVHPEADLVALARALARHRRPSGEPLVWVSDEAHREQAWGVPRVPSPAMTHPDTVVIHSFGKAWSLQGQRTGLLAVAPSASRRDVLLLAIDRALRSTGTCAATAVMQEVAARLAGLDPAVDGLASDQLHVRRRLADAGFRVVPGQASAFVYLACPPDVTDVGLVDELAEAGLLVMPSRLFHHDGCIRLALNVGRERLDTAVSILTAVAGAHRDEPVSVASGGAPWPR